MLDLHPIKARLAAATPGPWKWDLDMSRQKDGGALVLELLGKDGDIILTLWGFSMWPWSANRDVVANAPQDLAALVAEVERLRGAINKHKNQILNGGYSSIAADAVLWSVLSAISEEVLDA